MSTQEQAWTDPRETRALAFARDRKMAALWYAFGRIDGGDPLPLDAAHEFAEEHAADAYRYRMEETGSLASIMDAWQAYAAGRGVIVRR